MRRRLRPACSTTLKPRVPVYGFPRVLTRLNRPRLIQIMNRKGSSWDNVCAESFVHSINAEAIIEEPLIDRTEIQQRRPRHIPQDSETYPQMNSYDKPGVIQLNE